MNVTSAPNPETIPFTSDKKNIDWMQDTREARKTVKKAYKAPTITAIREMEENLNKTMNSGLTEEGLLYAY